MATVISFQTFKQAADNAAAAQVDRQTAVRWVADEQRKGGTGRRAAGLIERRAHAFTAYERRELLVQVVL